MEVVLTWVQVALRLDARGGAEYRDARGDRFSSYEDSRCIARRNDWHMHVVDEATWNKGEDAFVVQWLSPSSEVRGQTPSDLADRTKRWR